MGRTSPGSLSGKVLPLGPSPAGQAWHSLKVLRGTRRRSSRRVCRGPICKTRIGPPFANRSSYLHSVKYGTYISGIAFGKSAASGAQPGGSSVALRERFARNTPSVKSACVSSSNDETRIGPPFANRSTYLHSVKCGRCISGRALLLLVPSPLGHFWHSFTLHHCDPVWCSHLCRRFI